MVSSFDASLLSPFRRWGFTVGWLVGEEAAAAGLGALAGTLFRLRPQYINLPIEAARVSRAAPLFFRFLRAIGFQLLFWTVNSAADAADLAPHSRIIVTDEVEVIVKAVAQK